MSVDIVIRQRGFFGRPLPLDVIIGDRLLFGSMDADMRIRVGGMDGGELIIYDPSHVGRGFSVCWRMGERKIVSLRMLTPTTSGEIRSFCETAARIARYWHGSVEWNGKRLSPEAFLDEMVQLDEYNRRALEGMAQRIISGESGNMTLHAVRWPLVVGCSEAQRILEDPEFFANWLHSLQMVDAERVSMQFEKKTDGMLGAVILERGRTQILPEKPSVPMEKDLVCERFVMRLCSEGVLGEGEYSDLFKRLPKSKIRRYDADSVLVQPLTKQEMEAMLRK